MSRDLVLEKHKYSAASYIGVLDHKLPSCWVLAPTTMQDNASIHNEYKVHNLFLEMGILCATDYYAL